MEQPSPPRPADYQEYPADEMATAPRLLGALAEIRRRRSVRSFSSAPPARTVIEQCIAAARPPGGANHGNLGTSP